MRVLVLGFFADLRTEGEEVSRSGGIPGVLALGFRV